MNSSYSHLKTNNFDNKEKEKLKLEKLLIEQIFDNKNQVIEKKIPKNYFKLINISKFGDCFYACLSTYFFKNESKNLEIRNNIFDYIKNYKEKFTTYFEGYYN